MIRKEKKKICCIFSLVALIACLLLAADAGKQTQAAVKLTTPAGFLVSEKTPNSVKLSWKASDSADGYQIFRSEKKNGAYQKVKTISNADCHTWTDYGRVPEKTYYYRIRSYTKNSTGNVYSAKSTAVKAKIPTAVEKYGRLSVKGSQMVDQHGKAVQLRGVSSHGMSWYPQYLNEKAFRTMRDEWGVEVVRLAMYTAEYNGYCTGSSENQKKLRREIYDAVDAAEKLGMYVIIDWHILTDQNPQTYQSQAKAFFKTMAKRYANADHVIYEICNEPNGNTTWPQIKKYANTVIKTIRTYDKRGIIIVGTPTWSQDVDQAAASPISGYKNLMYAFHFYAGTHKDQLRAKVKAAAEAGLPIFVTEYGICDASGSGSINREEAAKWMRLLNDYKISSCIWNLSNKSETSALLRPDCTKIYGWGKKDLSDSGKWFVRMMQSSLASVGTGKQSDSAANAGSGGNAASAAPSETTENNVADVTLCADGCNIRAAATNNWGESPYYKQYSVSIQNTGAKPLENWKLVLSFSDTIELDSGWCGTYQVKGKTLTITPETYNNRIEAGSVVENIGFIVKGAHAPKLVKLAVK